MVYIYGFLFCGFICMIGQYIYEKSTLTFGHITSLFVVCGSILECLNIYDFLIEKCGIGASLPILSFGHSLTHAALANSQNEGILGIFTGVFDKTSSGISFAIFIAFITAILFKPHD